MYTTFNKSKNLFHCNGKCQQLNCKCKHTYNSHQFESTEKKTSWFRYMFDGSSLKLKKKRNDVRKSMELVSIYILTVLRKEASETSLTQLTQRETGKGKWSSAFTWTHAWNLVYSSSCVPLSTIHHDHAEWTRPIIVIIIIKSIHNV